MRVSSYNPQDRYRRRMGDRMAALLVVVFVVGLAFGLGFVIGKQAAGFEDRSLREQVKLLSQEREELQEQVTQLHADTQTSAMRFEQLEAEFQSTVPDGPMRELVGLLKKQIDEGRDPERLAFLIRSARPPRNCSEPETKRFVVTTPTYKGPSSQVALAEGQLLISGSGSSAVNANGQPEAWYDPTKRVDIRFAVAGEAEQRKRGVMPIRKSMVVGTREYRMTVTEAAKSFAKVTFDSCDYP